MASQQSIIGSTDRCTDIGNAAAFARDHEGVVRYAHTLGGWHTFDGCRWAYDDTGEVMRLARVTVANLFRQALNCGDKTLARWALTSASRNRLDAMLSMAQSEPTVAAKAGMFDRNPWVLNTLSGIVDLKTGDVVPHDPRAFITKLAPSLYNETALAPRWLNFLNRIMAGDAGMIEFLQRAVGYSITAETSEQLLFMPYGTGANGKSTFLEVLRDVLGDYVMQTPAQMLMLNPHGAGIPNDLARLRGARFVTAVETEDGRRLSESLVKQMTGGDTITARFLHREFFEFRATFKVWLATNHKPTIRGTDHAMWRRIRLIPFAVTIPEQEWDKQLQDRLLEERTGILRWAVEGCLSWQRIGLREPTAVLEATRNYREEMDILTDFLTDCCVVAPGRRTTFAALYGAYAGWARDRGEEGDKLSSKAFSLQLQQRGFRPGRDKGHRYFDGLGLAVAMSEGEPA